VTTRRTTVLAVVALAGCVLVPVGALLLYLGTTQDQGLESVAGILALVLGLACVRVLFWVRRARLLTRVGLSFHQPEDGSDRGG
jgi:uncharacterized membrane protein HdeD (DUF308 family)